VDCNDDDNDDDDDVTPDDAVDRRYKVVFHLYGMAQNDIDKVIKEIDELGKEAVSDRVLDTADNQVHIAKLTADQVLTHAAFASFISVSMLVYLLSFSNTLYGKSSVVTSISVIHLANAISQL